MSASFVFVCVCIPSGVMRIYIPNINDILLLQKRCAVDALWPVLQLLRGGMYMLWMCSCWRLSIVIEMLCYSRWGSDDSGWASVLSTKGIVSLISISWPPPFFLVAVKSHRCPSWSFQRLSLVGQLGFMDSGNVDIVAVVESQQISDFSADSVRIHCISRKRLVGVGVESGQGFISISPAHWYRGRSNSAGIRRSAAKMAIWLVEIVWKFWLSVCDPASKRLLPFGPEYGSSSFAA